MKPQTVLLIALYLIIFGLIGYFLYQRYFNKIINLPDNSQTAIVPDKTIFYNQGNNLYQLNADVLNASSKDIANLRLQSTGQVNSIVINKTSNLFFYEVTTPTQNQEIWQVNLKDNQSEKLVSNQTPGLENCSNFRNPKLSADQQYLAFITTCESQDLIFSYNLTEKSFTNLTYPNFQGQISDIDWSKSNPSLYFITTTGGKSSLENINLKGEIQSLWENPTVISKLTITDKKIILTYQPNEVINLGFFDIGNYNKINPITDLVSPKSVIRYNVSSAGNKIVYQVNDKNTKQNDIFTVGVDATNLLQLTNDGKSYYPIFSPNGEKIAFWIEGEGIYTIGVNKTSKSKILNDQSTINNIIIWS